MNPGLGKGTTFVITLRRNHSMPRRSARLFTAGGLIRVSIGPPIRIMERGAAGQRRKIANCPSIIPAVTIPRYKLTIPARGWIERRDGSATGPFRANMLWIRCSEIRGDR
ncbi:hypothetical protein [Paraburkholderia mimosarum]|uniref:hypothetical protein n=1 Tax=Paraburkholderia mimosarum TaxID=312026 RepID=UPI002351D86D|nr:hypothetical protein [Paraburkholderia mimosarum]